MGQHLQGLGSTICCRSAAPLSLGANGVVSFSEDGKDQDFWLHAAWEGELL